MADRNRALQSFFTLCDILAAISVVTEKIYHSLRPRRKENEAGEGGLWQGQGAVKSQAVRNSVCVREDRHAVCREQLAERLTLEKIGGDLQVVVPVRLC